VVVVMLRFSLCLRSTSCLEVFRLGTSAFALMNTMKVVMLACSAMPHFLCSSKVL